MATRSRLPRRCSPVLKMSSSVSSPVCPEPPCTTRYYDDWQNEETFVPRDPLGNPVDKRHPWNQTTLPKPQKRDLEGGKYSWVMSPRWFDKRTGDHLALDTGGGALARLWATALANKVHTPYVNATGNSVKIDLPRSAQLPDM